MTTLHERLEDIFRNVFNDDLLELDDSSSAQSVAGWDSVAHINLMFGIESAFGVQFPGNTFAEFRNIGELKDYLSRHVS
jgi:acyl carrier protein